MQKTPPRLKTKRKTVISVRLPKAGSAVGYRPLGDVIKREVKSQDVARAGHGHREFHELPCVGLELTQKRKHF